MDENIKNEQNYLANFENKSEGVAEVLVGSPGLLEGQEPKVIGGGGTFQGFNSPFLQK